MTGVDPKEIEVYKFSTKDPFGGEQDSLQLNYIRTYLSDLGTETVIEEPYYFDRDYLSEFASFYSTSAHGYPNTCRRLHFFSNSFSKAVLENAAAGIASSQKRIEKSYLGFVVLRPIPAAPLGRTVLRSYPERLPNTPRVDEPARYYESHLVGLTLRVFGLAWQQQDTGVGACATVGLWTMLHSSAFDPRHAIPTTTDVTLSAHKRAALGTRIFPSSGLTVQQICEAMKDRGLAPALSDGNVVANGFVRGFARERFSSSIAAYIRSGYPVLLIGRRSNDRHAICVVGFRSHPQPRLKLGETGIEDGTIQILYVHDDNIGPNVRFEIEEFRDAASKKDLVCLSPKAPKNVVSGPPYPRVNFNFDPFIPEHMLVAVHDDLRTSPDAMHRAGIDNVRLMSYLVSKLPPAIRGPVGGLTFSTRFIRLADYLEGELGRTLRGAGELLSKVRLELCERVPPMSLHLGVIRVASTNSTPLVDILYDTTDSDRNHPVFAHVVYYPLAENLLAFLAANTSKEFGVLVKAY
jgi:hypothetical protein